MRHIANFGLLFAFVTLAATGAMAYFLPFSLVTTRVHIVFGLATVVLVGLHLVSRVRYFRSQLSFGGRAAISKLALLSIVSAWAVLLAIAFKGWEPAESLVAQSYEARNHKQIVRASTLAGFQNLPENRRVVARSAGEDADVAVSLYIGFAESIETPPAVAVWAETTAGTMIETLYIDPALAYTETPTWNGKATPRNHILPIWRHRYTAISGVDPTGDVDGVTGATRTHSFSLDDYLRLGGAKEFVLCVEVNAPADPNEHFTASHIGQPSLLYTAYIEVD
ncbi:MAG: DUF2271 domain-containing protein, partial [Pirellulales bacterium]|nr:DUF2271 domain-containing protein [Pirellulales bacterium]